MEAGRQEVWALGKGAPISPSTEDCLCPFRRMDLGSFSNNLDFYKTLFLGEKKDLKGPENGGHPFPADSSSSLSWEQRQQVPLDNGETTVPIPGLISNNPGDFSKTHTISLSLHFVISTRGHTPSACCMGLEPCD